MIYIKSLKKSFQVESKIIPTIDIQEFAIKKGEQIVIHGPSGSGKTTLLNLIAGISLPDEGEIQVNGQALSELSPTERDLFRAKHIGYIFQTYNLISALSAQENIEIALLFSSQGSGHERKRTALEILEIVGLKKKKDNKPHQLSSGEQQRVAMARAFVTRPGLILADEPTAHLDLENAKNLMSHMKSLGREQNQTLIVVTHNLEMMEGFRAVSFGELNRIREVRA